MSLSLVVVASKILMDILTQLVGDCVSLVGMQYTATDRQRAVCGTLTIPVSITMWMQFGGLYEAFVAR